MEGNLKTKSKGKVVAISIIGIILALLAIIVICYFTILTDPVNIYKKISKKIVGVFFEPSMYVQNNSDITSTKLALDASLDLNKPYKDDPITELLENIDLTVVTEQDNKEKQTVVNFATFYNKESMLDLSVFMKEKDNNIYLYAKELLDYYISIDMEEQDTGSSISALTVLSEVKAHKIVKDAFANIITSDMCYKEDGAYVLKTTNIVLINNLKNVLENLRSNKEFLECFENQSEVDNLLKSLIESITTEGLDKYDIKIKLYFDMLLNIEKMVAEIVGETSYQLVVKCGKNKLDLLLNENAKKIVDGEILTEDIANGTNINVNLNIDDLGKVNIKIMCESQEIEQIQKIDENKTKKIEEINMFELMSIIMKIENSKLGEFITELTTVGSPETYINDFEGFDTPYIGDFSLDL